MSEAMIMLLCRGVWETLVMTFVSGFFGFVIGLPLGVLYMSLAQVRLLKAVHCIAHCQRW